MRLAQTHDFRGQQEYRIELEARRFVAIVDLESYPAFISKTADRLDLLQHICHEMDALTATMWEVPEAPLRLQLIWAPDETIADDFIRRGLPLASGVIRSGGQLCLIDDEHLLLASREPHADLAGDDDGENAQLLLLPTGIYAVTIFNSPALNSDSARPLLGYTIILTYHPHPPPRQHPVRLNGLLPFGRSSRAGEQTEATPDSRDSHKMPR